MEEIWRDIPGYEGFYQISNLGRVKSLSRKVTNYRGSHYIKDRILKNIKDYYGYEVVCIRNKKIKETRKIHQLVAMAFLNHKPDGTTRLVVDHINNNPSDNRLENLQIITHRENSSKDRKNKTSIYTGVSLYRKSNKWISQIIINGKIEVLGYFTCELEASNTYQNKLKEINGISK